MAEKMGKFSSIKEETKDNIAKIEKPNGVFYILYSGGPAFSVAHTQTESAEGIKGWQGIALEGVGPYASYEPGAISVNENDSEYKEIIQAVKEQGKPIFYVDAQTKNTLYISLLQKALRGIEAGVAAWIIGQLAIEVSKSQKITTRRDFLKRGGKGLLGLYLATPSIGSMASLARHGRTSDSGIAAKVSYFLDDLNEHIHPETQAIVQTFRNYLMAQKLEAISNILGQQNQIDKPKIGLVIGNAHSGIENAIKESPEKRLEILNILLSVPGIEKEKEALATITRLDYIDGRWQLSHFQDPGLKILEGKLN